MEAMEVYRVLDKEEIIKAGDKVWWANSTLVTYEYEIGNKAVTHLAPVYRKIRVQSEGYRYLDDGEVIKEGDEFLRNDDASIWSSTSRKGEIVDKYNKHLVYRRKIDVKAKEAPTKEEPKTNVTQKYCYLKEGDVLQEGDEIYYHDDEDRGGYWHKSNIPGHVVSRYDAIQCCCRRPIKEAQPIVVPKYEYLKQGDVIQEGDEVLLIHIDGSSSWGKTLALNYALSKYDEFYSLYRRPIKEAQPEADIGYIYLKDGDILQEGDEILQSDDKTWLKTIYSGYKVGGELTTGKYRRNITKINNKVNKMANNLINQLGDEILKNKSLEEQLLEEILKNETLEDKLKEATKAIDIYKESFLTLLDATKVNEEKITKLKKDLKDADDMLDEADETTDALNKDLDKALKETEKLKHESEQRLKTNLALTEDLNNLKHKLNQQDSFSIAYQYPNVPRWYYNPGKL